MWVSAVMLPALFATATCTSLNRYRHADDGDIGKTTVSLVLMKIEDYDRVAGEACQLNYALFIMWHSSVCADIFTVDVFN